MDQTGHAKKSPGTFSSLAVRLEQGRKPNSTSCRVSRLPGVGAQRQSLKPHDHRGSRTQRRARRPPCLPARDQRFNAPQSRQGATGTLRRPLGRPKHLDIFHVSCAQDADSACTRARRNFQRICAHVGWPGAPAMGEGTVAHARDASHSLALVQTASTSRRCLAEPTRAIQFARQVTPSWPSASRP